MAAAVNFFQQLGAFATAVEADCSEIACAMQLPAGASGSCGSFSHLLEDSLECLSHTRDKTSLLLSTLTSPSLQDLVDVMSGMYEANQKQLDALEDALMCEPGYVTYSVAGSFEEPMAYRQPSGRLSNDGRVSTGGMEENFNPKTTSAAIPYKNNTYNSPVSLPAHLQVEPKTPDMDDFGISSCTLTFLEKEKESVSLAQSKAQAHKAVPNTIQEGKVSQSASGCAALDMSPGLSARYRISPDKIKTMPVPAEETIVKEEALASLVSTTRGEGSRCGGAQGGDTLFPLMPAVTNEQFNDVPEYLRSQISCELLNSAVNKINDFVTDKRFDPDNGSDYLTTEELQNKLRLGIKTKAYVLLLMHLGRIRTAKHKGQVVYKIVA